MLQEGATCFGSACKKGSKQCAEFLLKKAAELDKDAELDKGGHATQKFLLSNKVHVGKLVVRIRSCDVT